MPFDRLFYNLYHLLCTLIKFEVYVTVQLGWNTTFLVSASCHLVTLTFDFFDSRCSVTYLWHRQPSHIKFWPSGAFHFCVRAWDQY